MRGVMRVRFVLVSCRSCHGFYLCESLDGKSVPVVSRSLFKIEQGLDRCRDLMPNDIQRVFRMVETGRHADKNRLAVALSSFGGMCVGDITALRVGDRGGNAKKPWRVVRQSFPVYRPRQRKPAEHD